MKFTVQNIGDLAQLAEAYKIELAALLAVIQVESNGQVYAAGLGTAPVIRWEGHYFYNHLKGADRDLAVRRGLASPKAGAIKNPAAQKDRYNNLLAPAARINSHAAYSSISMGVGQVMGSHYSSLSFDSPRTMFDYCTRGMISQVDVMMRFIKANYLIDELQRHDWSAFARGYNGKNYEKNKYHTKLANAYADALTDPLVASLNKKFEDKGSASSMLRLGSKGAAVRELQALLVRAGASIKVDGDFGPATKEAVINFQLRNDLEADGVVGPRTNAVLTSYKRNDETAVGAEPILENPKVVEGGGSALVGAGTAAAADKLSELADKMQGMSDTMAYVAGGLYAVAGILVVGGVLWGAYGFLKSKKTYEGV